VGRVWPRHGDGGRPLNSVVRRRQMSILDNSINRSIAAVVALAGVVATALSMQQLGADMSPIMYAVLIAAFFGFLLLLSRVMAKSRLAHMRFPRSLEVWGRYYTLLLMVFFVAGVVGPIFVSPHLNLSDLPWLAGFGLISISVYGLVAFVVLILPVWGIVQLSRAAYRRFRREGAGYSNGDV
jgi:hypothetical protein